MEDIIALLIGQPALLDEIESGDTHLHRSILTDLGRLAGIDDFLDTVPYYFPGEAVRRSGAEPFTQRLRQLRLLARARGLL